MEFDIDSGIFIGFLVATIILGLASSSGIKNIKEYAIGNRNFSTATIAATIIATWISGDFFYNTISNTYHKGLYSVWVDIGSPISLLIYGLFFAPRVGEFLGKLSIADAMGGLFGQKVRVITAISGFIGTAGLIAVQLKLSGLIFGYTLGISNIYGITLAAVVVTLYSSLGGIKSVTFTDVLQFFTFAVVIPIIAYVLLNSIDTVDSITNTLTTHKLFDYKEVFGFSNQLSFYQFFLFLFFICPGFSPAIFQRKGLGKNILYRLLVKVINRRICRNKNLIKIIF